MPSGTPVQGESSARTWGHPATAGGGDSSDGSSSDGDGKQNKPSRRSQLWRPPSPVNRFVYAIVKSGKMDETRLIQRQ